MARCGTIDTFLASGHTTAVYTASLLTTSTAVARHSLEPSWGFPSRALWAVLARSSTTVFNGSGGSQNPDDYERCTTTWETEARNKTTTTAATNYASSPA
eukprot:scpid96476/ scgid34556/ 